MGLRVRFPSRVVSARTAGFSAMIALLSFPAHGQGLIVNEASNGPSGAKEFWELVVVGSAANPTGPVDLDGWIIDDNNGDWEGTTTGVGIAPGYARLDASSDSAACSALSAMVPGSIILVYNDSDPNPNVPADDTTDANGDGVYVLPARGSCVKTCSGPPNSSDNSYSSCSPAATPSYSPLALRNAGDVAQSRNAKGSLFHGFTYGDISAPYPVGSFSITTSSGSGSSFVFSCGDWTDRNNFSRVSSTAETPGSANDSDNANFLANIASGNFDYTSPSTKTNCVLVAQVQMSKSSQISLDPVNGTTNPKAIPGAVVSYCLLVSNSGSTSADSLITTDTIPADISYSAGSMRSGIDCSSASTAEDDDNVGADESDPLGASISGSVITIVAKTLAPSESFALTFNVTID